MGVPNRTRYFVRVSSKVVGKIEFLDSHERASYSRAIIILYSRIELGQPAVYQPDCNRVSSPAVCTDGIGFAKHAGQIVSGQYSGFCLSLDTVAYISFRRKIQISNITTASSIESHRRAEPDLVREQRSIVDYGKLDPEDHRKPSLALRC